MLQQSLICSARRREGLVAHFISRPLHCHCNAFLPISSSSHEATANNVDLRSVRELMGQWTASCAGEVLNIVSGGKSKALNHIDILGISRVFAGSGAPGRFSAGYTSAGDCDRTECVDRRLSSTGVEGKLEINAPSEIASHLDRCPNVQSDPQYR